MRISIPPKFLSWLLLVVMVTVTINGVHESAHALQCQVNAVNDQASLAGLSASHHCPCAPLEQDAEPEGCDTCVNCDCHGPLTMHQFDLRYNPVIVNLQVADIVRLLPEVYLAKFIPPQNQA